MQWVTQRRPKIDRLACPWLISRFIDADPEFLFVPVGDVLRHASATGAIPFDIAGVELSHKAGANRIATIVCAADNDNPAVVPEAAGLRAISFGLAGSIRNDHDLLAQGLVLYDALYRWARKEAPHAAPAERSERGFALWLARHHERRKLAELDDRLLFDIGVSREEVRVEADMPFWRPWR
jgi:hypothetical protein